MAAAQNSSPLEHLLAANRHLAAVINRQDRKIIGRNAYSVGIIGMGRVGSDTAIELVAAAPEIGPLVLCSRDTERLKWKRSELQSKAKAIERGLVVETCSYDSLERILQTDIVVVTAGAPVVPGEDRDIVLGKNIAIIRYIAERFKGYEGAVIIVPNPVERLTYAFASCSKIDPSRVTGLTHVDTVRFRNILSKALGNEYKATIPAWAFVIGAHDEKLMVPLYSQARTDPPEKGVPVESLKLATERFRATATEELQDYAKTAARVLAPIGGTAPQASDAVCQVINAMIYEEETVCAATFMRQREIYASYPVVFRNFEAKPQPPELSDSEKAEFDRVQGELGKQVDELLKKGLIKERIRVPEEPEPEKDPAVEEAKRAIGKILAAAPLNGQERRRLEEAISVLDSGISERAAVNLAQRVQVSTITDGHALRGNKILAAARTNGVGCIYIVNIETGAVDERRLSTINSAVGLAVAEVEGRKAILAGTRMGVQQWSPETLEVERTYRAPKTDHRINSIGTAMKDGEQYVVGAARDGLYVWRSTHPIPIRQAQLTGGIRQALTIDDKILAANSEGGIVVFDLELNQTGELSAEEVTCLSYASMAGKKYVFAGERQATVRAWIYESGRFTPMAEKDSGYRVNCIDSAEINGEPVFVTGTYGWGLKLTYPESGKAQEFSGHREDILAVSIAKIGNTHYIAAGNKKGTLYCWDIKKPDTPLLATPLGQGIEAVRICGF